MRALSAMRFWDILDHFWAMKKRAEGGDLKPKSQTNIQPRTFNINAQVGTRDH